MDFGRESGQPDVAQALIGDHRSAALDPADRALCDYAVKVTRTPGDLTAADVDALRVHGFDDEAITVATQVIAYFNYINRIADALGVDLEAWMEPDEAAWKQAKS